MKTPTHMGRLVYFASFRSSRNRARTKRTHRLTFSRAPAHLSFLRPKVSSVNDWCQSSPPQPFPLASEDAARNPGPKLTESLASPQSIRPTGSPLSKIRTFHANLHTFSLCVTSPTSPLASLFSTPATPSRPLSPSICRTSAAKTNLPMRWNLSLASTNQILVALRLGEFFF